MPGSSPLARGTRVRAYRPALADRFIPARAGNTCARRPRPRRTPVHPRSRGEHPSIQLRMPPRLGSSPLARGTQQHPRRHDRPARFIPARAGNTSRPSWGSGWAPVHPRSRGEHDIGATASLARVRFIPARAGNTLTCAAVFKSRTVHPRSRGEHRLTTIQRPNVSGSSPLARGTRPQDHEGADRPRFIPARAGNTSSALPSAKVAPVHPRSRGEHVEKLRLIREPTGSSPLARGTHRPQIEDRSDGRFIPARAGNTCAIVAMMRSCTVHPRSRGEHLKAGPLTGDSLGSSPLARGTPSVQ